MCNSQGALKIEERGINVLIIERHEPRVMRMRDKGNEATEGVMQGRAVS